MNTTHKRTRQKGTDPQERAREQHTEAQRNWTQGGHAGSKRNERVSEGQGEQRIKDRRAPCRAKARAAAQEKEHGKGAEKHGTQRIGRKSEKAKRRKGREKRKRKRTTRRGRGRGRKRKTATGGQRASTIRDTGEMTMNAKDTRKSKDSTGTDNKGDDETGGRAKEKKQKGEGSKGHNRHGTKRTK
ncbi:hypothetical protein, conserved in T. vivax [Trypanosoma vivax Y486]|uniref:Uncharacterized protein n=1 Tax=Trypanosoma vivax (strain Y486) TaxID=1055687 RepID=F9WLZ1_TRYVY|nr:hypothetical protein, conserved in T. vivax [Trypanosoma vivax Y486]|eukprot:CCD18537.1 hypothetical protein, conserved in T. vivax [Trypanosoma vivax Y486]